MEVIRTYPGGLGSLDKSALRTPYDRESVSHDDQGSRPAGEDALSFVVFLSDVAVDKANSMASPRRISTDTRPMRTSRPVAPSVHRGRGEHRHHAGPERAGRPRAPGR